MGLGNSSLCLRVQGASARLTSDLRMTKLGFYNSSLSTGGGGEKYFLTIVDEATRLGTADVVMMSPKPPDHRAWERLGIEIDPRLYEWQYATDSTLTPKTRDLDLLFLMSWSLPLSLAATTINSVQYPFRRLYNRTNLSFLDLPKVVLQRQLVKRYDLVVCYSEFVRKAILTDLGRDDAVVINPPFTSRSAGSGEKKKIIVGVGRFFPTKRQDALIEAFTRLQQSLGAANTWELHLAGIVEDTSAAREYFDALQRRAERSNIYLHPDLGFAELHELCDQAAIFWHAAGLGYQDNPAKQEHLGIATVEAMDHGCVPVVIRLGGQPEIVTEGVNGYLWSSLDELVALTSKLVLDEKLRRRMSAAASSATGRYSDERFRRQVRDIILNPILAGGQRPNGSTRTWVREVGERVALGAFYGARSLRRHM